MSNSPVVIPEDFDFADLQRALNHLSNRAATYLMKNFSSASAALDFGRMLCAEVRPQINLNNAYQEYLQILSRSSLAFIEFQCSKGIRALASTLEPFAQLPIKLPYSSIVHGEHLNNEAFASLNRLEFSQVQQILKTIRKNTKTESIFRSFACYNGLLPQAEECYNSPSKTARKFHCSATEVTDIHKRTMERLVKPEVAAKIVMSAFSEEEGKYMLSQLPESHPFRETLKQRIQELHDHVGYNTPLEAADFRSQLHNMLAYYPITHIEQLASLSYEQFFRIRGISVTDCNAVMAYLKQNKMFFLDEKFYY